MKPGCNSKALRYTVDKMALGKCSSGWFDFPYNFPIYKILHFSHLSSRTRTCKMGYFLPKYQGTQSLTHGQIYKYILLHLPSLSLYSVSYNNYSAYRMQFRTINKVYNLSVSEYFYLFFPLSTIFILIAYFLFSFNVFLLGNTLICITFLF